MSAESGLALQFCNSLTIAELQRRPTAVAVIPQRNLIAVGSAGHIAVYDATSALRQSLTPIPQGHTPRLIQLTPSGQHLLLACAEWTVYHLPLKSVKPALLLSLSSQKKRPLDSPLMCFMPAFPGTNRVPLLFVTNRLKDSVRTAYLGTAQAPEKGAPAPVEGTKAAAPSKSGKELEAGAKLMLEKGKGAVALSSHPFEPILYVLSVNGELQMYRHVHGAPALTPLHQFTMLLEESKTATPLVEGAHLSAARCPYVPRTAMIFIFLPRLALFYIMTHTPGAAPKPYMRVPWPRINLVLSVELSPALRSLVVIAGAISGESRVAMRAWAIVGEEGCTAEDLRLVPRACSQRVSTLTLGSEAAVVFKEPAWARLWNGGAPAPVATSAQSGTLDLVHCVHPDRPSLASTAVPSAAYLVANPNLCVVRYFQRQSGAAGQAAAAQAHAPLAIFRILDLDHPSLQHPSAVVGALHTTPVDWHVSDVDGEAVQFLPHAAPFLQGQQVQAYFLATDEARVLRGLPAADSKGALVAADALVYSRTQHAALVFSAHVEDSSKRAFTYVDFAPPGDPDAAHAAPVPPYAPGVAGAFLGPLDETFVVLESAKLGSDNLAIYASGPTFSEDSLLGYTYLELATGDSVVAIWPGPPAAQLLADAEFDAEGNVVDDPDAALGSGIVLASTRQGRLITALVPAVEAGADADAELDPCATQYELELLQEERVLQVTWITMVPPEQVGYPSHCLGAILTTHRVIVVDGKLSALQSVPVAEPRLGVTHTITSLLWVGPALLLSHASGRIEQLLLNGKRVLVAAVARLGTFVLAGAAPDRLYLLHRRDAGWVFASRKVYVAALVMQAWLCLLSEGHPYGTWANVRLELMHIVKNYRVDVASDVALAEALLAAGCGDLLPRAVTLAETAGVSPCALAAASNNWEHATTQALKEYQLSAYAPCAPPEGSKLRQVLVTVSLGAMSQGKWSCAERCLTASGEQLLLLLLHALQHNRPALQHAVRRSSSETATHTLAMLLLAADARIGLRQTLQKDWHLSRGMQDTDASTWTFAESIVPAMKAQANRALRDDVGTQPGEEGPVAPMDVGSLAAHLGLSHEEILFSIASAPQEPKEDEEAPSKALDGKEGEDGEADLLAGEEAPELTEEEKEAAAARERFLAEFKGDSMFLDELAGDGGAPRPEQSDQNGASGGLIDIGGSDAEEGDVDINEANLRAGSAAPRKRGTGAGGAEEPARPEALGPPGSVPLGQVKKEQAAQGAGLTDLSDPWADLGLARPAGADDAAADAPEEVTEAEEVDAFAAFEDLDPFAGFAEFNTSAGAGATAGGSVMPFASAGATGASTGAPSPGENGAEARDGAGAAPGSDASPSRADSAAPDQQAQQQQAQQQQQPQAPPPQDPAQVPGFPEGVQAMFAGQWQQALAYFGQAFAACRDANAARLRCTVAQYAAVVGVLEGYGHVDEAGAARLSRYACYMPLLMLDHLSFLVNDAISRNLRAGNYSWCAARLEQLGHFCMAVGRPDLAQGVGARLQQVTATGVGDASVGAQESYEAVARAVDEAVTMQDVAAVVARVTAGVL